jgi:hypothetical protein
MHNFIHLYLVLVGISGLLFCFRFFYRLYLKPYLLKNQYYYAEYRALFGLVKRAVWRRGGMVLFFRDREIYCPDPCGQGGSKTVSRLFDEDICTWLPLTFQTSLFEEATLATRENCNIAMKLLVFWKIGNVTQFSKLFDAFIQSHNQADCSNLTVYGEQILRYIMRNILKRVMYQTTMPQLMFLCPIDIPQYADNYPRPNAAAAAQTKSTNLINHLCQKVKAELIQGCASLGIQILDVNIQEIRFPDVIQSKLEKYWQGTID